jgi:hypothetical protein
MYVFAAMAHPYQARNRYLVTMELEGMVSVDLLSDVGLFKPVRPNLPLFERLRYASCPFSSICSMDAVDQDFGAGRCWGRTDWIVEEELRGARPKRLVLSFPADDDCWTFAALAVLPNEKSHEWSLHHGPDSREKQTKTHGFLSFTGAAAPWSPLFS